MSQKISIITVVLNGKEHLEQTIQSVINQDYSNVEYIVIDGGSSDGSLDILKKYENKIDFWISEPDLGIYDAMNKGINVSTGDLIGIVSADDWLEPGALSTIARNFEDEDIIFGKYRSWNKNNSKVIENRDVKRLNFEMSVHHGSAFVKKDLFNELGLYPTRFSISSDYYFFLKVYKGAYRFKRVSDIIINSRRGGVSENRALLYKENMIIQKELNSLPGFIPEILYLLNVLSFTLKRILSKFVNER